MDKKTEDIKKEIEDEIKNEVKEEVKEEVRDEIKEKMKNEIKDEIHSTKKDDIRKDNTKVKTLYNEKDGLYRLVKNDLTIAEAVEIQGKINNGEYGKRTGWYRRKDDINKEKYCVWQLFVHRDDMSSAEITAVERSADIVEHIDEADKEKINKIDKETIDDIKESICKIKNYSKFNKNMNWLLTAAVGSLYAIGGAMYLYHIVHVGREAMILYGFGVALVVFALLWIHCECRKCSE